MAQTAREFSAGGVVVRQKDGQWWVAAIEPTGREAPGKKGGKGKQQAAKPVLTLPKGLIDPGEKPEETAVREIREETGLEAERVVKLGNVRYIYMRSWGDGARVFKVVTYYLFRYVSGRIGNITPEMRHEVEHASWIPLQDAVKQLTYKGDREMARAALEYIQKNPGFQ
ncbi:MAG TPA: NUDIX domain-containing protein [Terriglobales bacterium]|jgi:8-oxo-dGTP pyrophosphatase MutT (NUDIX family)|nr:NUDIX domain-containing protein [Terriglobales bacterium]